MIPTSPLRVFEQAPTIQPGQFLADANLVEKGAQAFQRGMELPLMKEKIKHEKLRLKLEQDKLAFAMSEVGQREAEEARKMAALQEAGKLALLEAQIGNMQAQTAATVQQNQPLSAAEILGPAPEAPLQAAPEAAAPTQEAIQFDIYDPNAAAPTQEAAAVPSLKYSAAFTTRKPMWEGNVVAVDSPEKWAYQKLAQEMEPRFRGAVRKDAPALAEVVAKAKSEFKPRRDTVVDIDERGVPIALDVTKVGDDIIEVVGEPRIAIDKLSDAAKAKDAAFVKNRAELTDGQIAADLQNVERLAYAAELLAEAEAGNLIEGSRLIKFLPDTVAKLIAPKSMLARDQVRTVVQSALRETLGAQFARVEGEMMMDRALELAFEPEANYRLIRDALAVAETTLSLRRAADAYFRENGTLAGYEAPTGMVSDSPALRRVDAARSGSKASPRTPALSGDALATEYLKPPRKTRG